MLKAENLSISFNGKDIFSNVSFILNDKEKIGLIGKNGCGKTTLLKIINNDLVPDSGQIVKSRNYTIGYLKQYMDFRCANIVDEVCAAMPEYKRDNFWDAEKMLLNLGFAQDDLNKNPNEFSGGWQIRINFAKLLAMEPDLLLLDEPTNYLDIVSIRWLKTFLQTWRHSFILITHDRSFMDDVVDHILLIHRGTSQKITGNTQNMYDKIALEEDNYEKTRINEEKKRKQVQTYIDRFRYKANIASRVQSHIKMLERQEVKTKLDNIATLDFKFAYQPFYTNNVFFSVDNLTFGYSEDNILIKNLSFSIKPHDKVGIIGKNGKGKSTLMDLLSGRLSPLSGVIRINNKAVVGYFGQTNKNVLRLDHTIEEELWSVDKSLTRTQVLRMAGNMMFPDELAQKKISVLSGGEKSRVLLGKVLLKPCNLLMLDEPTNHLDMDSSEAFLKACQDFEGALFIVSHNETVLNNLISKLIVFDDNKVFLFDGTYKDFLTKVGWSQER